MGIKNKAFAGLYRTRAHEEFRKELEEVDKHLRSAKDPVVIHRLQGRALFLVELLGEIERQAKSSQDTI